MKNKSPNSQFHLQEEVRKLRNEISDIRASLSFKVGSMITFPLRLCFEAAQKFLRIKTILGLWRKKFLREIQQNIDIVNNSHCVLIFDHSLGGGTNVFSEKLINEKKCNKESIFIVTSDPVNNRKFSIGIFFNKYKYLCNYCDIKSLEEILNKVKFKEVIINELVSFYNTNEILNLIVKAQNKHKFITKLMVHDYYLICPNFTLFDSFGKYCDVPQINKCADCISKVFIPEQCRPNKYKDLLLWRKTWGNFLRKVDEIICFSKSSKKIILKAYPRMGLEDRIIVKPHSVDFSAKPNNPNMKSGTINIGILGHVSSEAKGGLIVKKISKILNYRPDLRLIVIGTVNKKFMTPNIKVHGEYNIVEIPKLTKKYDIDIFFVPSVCPETFSYTTQEIVNMDMPVVVFNIGALPERIENYDKGILINELSAEKALEAITGYMDNVKQNPKKNINIAVLFLHYYRNKYPNSFEKIKSCIDGVGGCNATYIKIDNYETEKPLKKIEDRIYELGGDNSEREFSGWQKGLEALRAADIHYDVVIFINESFSAYGENIIEREDIGTIIYDSIAANAVSGRFDNGQGKFFLTGGDVSEWICANCIIVPQKIMDEINSIIGLRKEKMNIFFDDEKLTFKADAPINENFRMHIVGWLTKSWHSKFDIGNETWDFFKNKTFAIFNEVLFTAKLKERNIKIIAIKKTDICHR